MIGLKVDTTYYDALDQLGDCAFKAAETLRMLSIDFKRADMYIAQIDQISNEANEVASELINKVHNAFITPLDKEDFLKLTRFSQNIILSIHDISCTLVDLKVGKVISNFQKTSELLVEFSGFCKEAINSVRSKESRADLDLTLRRIKRLGNELNRNNWKAMGNHIHDKNLDGKTRLKWSIIYHKIETTLSHAYSTVDQLEMMVIKYA